MNRHCDFHRHTRQDYDAFLQQQADRFAPENTLRIDLHCHDHNSDVPDELWGRLLNLPETWLETGQLVRTLRRNRTDLITVTNHNNARSCWQLLDQGHDVLVGAEFTCHFPEHPLSIHVLTYGFTPAQEIQLNRKRHNLYEFLYYVREQDLVTVLPHPLFFYSHQHRPGLDVLEKFALLFQRFEVLNGQRGYWQNQLTRHWVASLTPQRIADYAKKHRLDPADFCSDPWHKSLTGGSDDHNGIFAGNTGTLLHVPNLTQLRQQQPLSVLALQALRAGQSAPFGQVGEEEKLSVTFLDYFAQVAIHMQDPGLLRLLLHKGALQDKVSCLAISNVMQELKRHRYTLTFLTTFHQALSGKKPALLTEMGVSREFKPALKILKQIAKTQRKQPEQFLPTIRQAIPALYQLVSQIFFQRLRAQLGNLDKGSLAELNSAELIRRFELPTQLRALFGQVNSPASDQSGQLNLASVLDSISFPALACGVLAGAGFAASQVIYANRPFLNELAEHLQHSQHPQRVLWLTDTFNDGNGVSSVLQSTLTSIQHQQLPIDLLSCHPTLAEQDHLVVLRPVASLQINSLGNQPLHIPDLMALQRLFEHGGYDRIICSTECVMGLFALYLKHAFSVPVYFFMHTDWLTFIQHTTQLNRHETDRIRRLLRAFYQQFDGVFVLNNEHRRWLTGEQMALPAERIFLTRHWADPIFCPAPGRPTHCNTPATFLYVGRLSEEKGVFDLPVIWQAVRQHYPTSRLIIIGEGPVQAGLTQQLPDAHFTGWLAKQELVSYYRQATLLLLPSRFDTFGCVVLEALSCGLPVAAYRSKGPADIIHDRQTGYLSDSSDQMSQAVLEHLRLPISQRQQMRSNAIRRSQDFSDTQILHQLMQDIGLDESPAGDQITPLKTGT